MAIKRGLIAAIAIVLFAGGNILILFISTNLLWGELEARLFTQLIGAGKLKLECPLLIAPWETAAIRTTVTNDVADQSTKPQVNAFISRDPEPRVVSQTLELSPLESQSLEWTVDAADIVFDRLILVSVVQRPYRDLETRQGSCSIYVFTLFDMSGRDTFLVLVALGILASVLGLGLLYHAFRPLSERMTRITQITAIFLLLVLAGLLSAVPRYWGLTLAFNAGAVLVITVANVEILFAPKKRE